MKAATSGSELHKTPSKSKTNTSVGREAARTLKICPRMWSRNSVGVFVRPQENSEKLPLWHGGKGLIENEGCPTGPCNGMELQVLMGLKDRLAWHYESKSLHSNSDAVNT